MFKPIIYNLDNKSVTAIPDDYNNDSDTNVNSLQIFYKEKSPYVAGGCYSGTIIIWNLSNY